MLPYQYDLMNVSFAKIALSVEQKVKIDALLNAQLLLESRTKYEVVNKYAARPIKWENLSPCVLLLLQST